MSVLNRRTGTGQADSQESGTGTARKVGQGQPGKWDRDSGQADSQESGTGTEGRQTARKVGQGQQESGTGDS